MYSLSILEARIRSQGWQCWFLLRALRESRFQASLLASGDGWQFLAFLGLKMCLSSFALSPHDVFPCVSASVSLLLLRTLVLD